MKTISKVLLCLSVISLWGCDKVYYHYSNSYILGYRYVSNVSATVISDSELPKIEITPASEDWVSVSFRDEGEKKEEFDAISSLHSDTNYNRKVGLILNMITTQIALYPDITSVIVNCDSDFDDLHPAGTSLNDLLTISYYSYYRFIASGYDENIYTPTYYTKNLSDIQSISLVPTTDDAYGVLSFTKAPDEAGTYTINITLICNEGTVFKTSAEVEF